MTTTDATKVTLVVWRDAKTDPPEAGKVVLTDEGMARCWSSGRVWEFDLPEMEGPCEPSVWCDPIPPGDDALAVEDLRYALNSGIADAEDDALMFHVGDPNGDGEQVFARRAARLRRALEATQEA